MKRGKDIFARAMIARASVSALPLDATPLFFYAAIRYRYYAAADIAARHTPRFTTIRFRCLFFSLAAADAASLPPPRYGWRYRA